MDISKPFPEFIHVFPSFCYARILSRAEQVFTYSSWTRPSIHSGYSSIAFKLEFRGIFGASKGCSWDMLSLLVVVASGVLSFHSPASAVPLCALVWRACGIETYPSTSWGVGLFSRAASGSFNHISRGCLLVRGLGEGAERGCLAMVIWLGRRVISRGSVGVDTATMTTGALSSISVRALQPHFVYGFTQWLLPNNQCIHEIDWSSIVRFW